MKYNILVYVDALLFNTYEFNADDEENAIKQFRNTICHIDNTTNMYDLAQTKSILEVLDSKTYLTAQNKIRIYIHSFMFDYESLICVNNYSVILAMLHSISDFIRNERHQLESSIDVHNEDELYMCENALNSLKYDVCLNHIQQCIDTIKDY